MHELLQKLQASGAAVRRVALPRKDGEGPELGLRILTEADYLDAGLAGIETLRGHGHEDATVANAELFEQAKATELLARALVDPATGERLAKNAAELRGALSRADKVFLVEQYIDHEREFSPSEATMAPEEFAQLLAEVKKTPAMPRLNAFSSVTLRRLVRSLAAPDES